MTRFCHPVRSPLTLPVRVKRKRSTNRCSLYEPGGRIVTLGNFRDLATPTLSNLLTRSRKSLNAHTTMLIKAEKEAFARLIDSILSVTTRHHSIPCTHISPSLSPPLSPPSFCVRLTPKSCTGMQDSGAPIRTVSVFPWGDKIWIGTLVVVVILSNARIKMNSHKVVCNILHHHACL